jgi:osmotically inducible protein OsmC
MSVIRKAEAQWEGDLNNGKGTIKLGSKAYEGPYSFRGRTSENSTETNPEELIGAALAGCFSMQLSALLTKAGHAPESIHTTANVHMLVLTTEAKVPGMQKEDFLALANKSEKECPMAKALAATKIEFTANFL